MLRALLDPVVEIACRLLEDAVGEKEHRKLSAALARDLNFSPLKSLLETACDPHGEGLKLASRGWANLGDWLRVHPSSISRLAGWPETPWLADCALLPVTEWPEDLVRDLGVTTENATARGPDCFWPALVELRTGFRPLTKAESLQPIPALVKGGLPSAGVWAALYWVELVLRGDMRETEGCAQYYDALVRKFELRREGLFSDEKKGSFGSWVRLTQAFIRASIVFRDPRHLNAALKAHDFAYRSVVAATKGGRALAAQKLLYCFNQTCIELSLSTLERECRSRFTDRHQFV